jgi:ABC-type multidrug transport system fused ATPase/permease subunit
MALAVWKNELVMVGTISALVAYTDRIRNSFFNFAYTYSQYVRAKTDIEQAQTIEEDFAKLHKYKQTPLQNWKEISVKNMLFKYEEDKKDVHLDNISFTIQKGKKIALVGESGSGKTTTLKLIRELYTAQDGTVNVDGKTLENGFGNIASSISLIPQDPEIFNSTIKENVTIGMAKNMKSIRKFAKLACFDNVAMKLPNKYNSSIQEKGVNLSGGEKQRLALTRGLLHSQDKEIILLDEPTSSVDPENELKIFKNIFRLYKQKTVIASVHRLHLLGLFDYIYIFKNGKIIGEGTYDFLEKSNKPFQKMLKKYSKK